MLTKARNSKRISVVFLAILVTACSATGLIGSLSSSSTNKAMRPMLILAPVDATATPTPFQPLEPTPIYLPTTSPSQMIGTSQEPVKDDNLKAWGDYAGPTIWPDIDIPPPTGILPQPKGQVNILLLGSDQRPNTGGFRTDTIILLTLNPAQGTANLTSFPRDLYVYIPGWTINRINTAFAIGGFESLATTFEYNFGVRPDYYILINFWSFVDVINSLGGIDVEIGRSLCDHRNQYGTYCVTEGTTHMDGETALWYVRSRYTSNDFDRGRRQQEVIRAGFKKLLSLDGITRAPELFEIYQQNVTTNISFDVVTSMLPLASRLGGNELINHYFIGPQQVYDYVTYSGAFVLIPIREAVMDVIRQAINSSD